jgi:hypothetical protein
LCYGYQAPINQTRKNAITPDPVKIQCVTTAACL